MDTRGPARGFYPLLRTVPSDLQVPPRRARQLARSASDMASSHGGEGKPIPRTVPAVGGRAPSRQFIRHYYDDRRCFLLLRRVICLSQAGSSAWFRSENLCAVAQYSLRSSPANQSTCNLVPPHPGRGPRARPRTRHVRAWTARGVVSIISEMAGASQTTSEEFLRG